MKKSKILRKEAEAIVREHGSEIETWFTDRHFVDVHGADGHIFKNASAARRAVLSGSEHQNALDLVDGAMTDEDWVDYLERGGVDRKQAEGIISRGQWGRVVRIIVDSDGPEWFLSSYSGGVYALSDGLLYY